MLDVHPPHSPTHTWKDFFIHIATIVVGLIIAVGLEQMVEAIHRQHERHQLEEELHTESEILQRNAEIDIGQYDSLLKFQLALRKDLNLRIAGHDKLNPPARTYVTPPHGHGVPGAGTMVILNPIWESAKDDGRLALLPEGLRRAYGVVSGQKRAIDTSLELNSAAQNAVNSFAFQFSDIRTPRAPDLSQMSEAQWIELRALVTDAFEKLRLLRTQMVDFSGELNLVLAKELIDQRVLSPLVTEVLAEARAAHREDFAKVADEIDAEDAARPSTTTKPAKMTR